jgi:hypothetical protein
MNLMRSIKTTAILDGILCFGLATVFMVFSFAEGSVQTHLFAAGFVAFLAGMISLNSFLGFRTLESRIEALERERRSTH